MQKEFKLSSCRRKKRRGKIVKEQMKKKTVLPAGYLMLVVEIG